MKPRQELDAYLAEKLLPSFRFGVEYLHGSYDIDVARQERSLSALGEGMFMDAVRGYLAGCREQADELVSKAEAFLELAHSIGETGDKNSTYAAGLSEGNRSVALSYVRWLKSGVVASALLADARFHFDTYYNRPGTLDRKTAEYEAPTLLYVRNGNVTKAAF